MPSTIGQENEIATTVLNHLLRRIESTPAQNQPFSHIYLEDVFPADVYAQVMKHLPEQAHYSGSNERHYGTGDGSFVRWVYSLSTDNVTKLADEQRQLWGGIAAALTAPELKQAMFAKLGRDLSFRYGVPETKTGELAGYARPTLYRETAGFEIPPHPDTRKKVVTMHLYFPGDRSQLDLGTALYRRKLLGWPLGGWRNRFEKVKQFVFAPNSGYAFVVNNKLQRTSWHGREELPPNAGVRNTLLNTFYEAPREGFSDYLEAA
jgi:hypothetical protein